MKIEQLIVQHLYNQKHITLQGIGSISLNPSVSLPAEGEKDFVMPENAFTFEYNLKATEDESLINFIIQQTRKIRPLATADLESFSILSRQFLNIGKPLVIEGVGTIQKNQAGDYEFIPGVFITPKIEDIPRQIKEKTEEAVSFESESRKDNTRRNMMLVFFVIIASLAGLGIYYFISNKKPSVPETVAQVQPVNDTPRSAIKTPDTSLQVKAPDTLRVTAAPDIKKDTNSFKIVIKDYPSAETANKALLKLTEYGHKVELIKVDSTKYHVAMPFNTPLSDTLRAKDSLRKFFGGKPYVLMQ